MSSTSCLMILIVGTRLACVLVFRIDAESVLAATTSHVSAKHASGAEPSRSSG